MTKSLDIITSDLDDVVSAGWPKISHEVLTHWNRVPPKTVANIRGRADLLISALSINYDISPLKAETITHKLAKRFDHFEESSVTFDTIRKHWPGFTREDFHAIKGRRSALVSLLQSRFALSRPHGWLQVERFFAQMS